MTPIDDTSSQQINRLRWQCRRGVLELDYLLTEFVEHQFAGLTPAQQADFARLLEESDQDLQRWLVGGEPPSDAGYAALIEAFFAARGR